MSHPNDAIRAGFYGLVLRADGYAPDEAAALVVQRYPGTRKRLAKLLAQPARERQEPDGAEAGLAKGASV